MANFYKRTAGVRLYTEKSNTNEKKYHRCIAALICDKDDQPYVAALCTGTKHNEKQCHSTPELQDLPCDGHAESLCYEIAPLYFLREMLNCLRGQESIFTFVPFTENNSAHTESATGSNPVTVNSITSKNGKFTLKPEIKFYLLVTEPPCGWITDQKTPCMEWKDSFKDGTHIPTCSARILIGSKMGIQGYVSHLIENPIFIDSIIILCAKNIENQKVDFSSSICDLPKISTLEYHPKVFNRWPKNSTFKPLNLVKLPNPDHGDYGDKEDESTCAVSSIDINQSIRDTNLSWSCYPRSKQPYEKNIVSDDDRLKISARKSVRITVSDEDRPESKQFQKDQWTKMKVEYDKLTDSLNLSDALRMHSKKVEDYTIKKKAEIQQYVENENAKVKEVVTKLIDGQYTSMDGWDDEMKNFKDDKLKLNGRRLIEKQIMLADLKSENLKLILDCSWKKYFDEPVSDKPSGSDEPSFGIQPSDS